MSEFIQSDELANTFTNLDELISKLNKQAIPVLANLNRTLKQINHAAYEHKNLTEYLGRHPESLIKGKN